MRAEDLLQTHTVWDRDTVELRLTGGLDSPPSPFQQAAATALNTRPATFAWT
ncbi:hypothetical protein [Streptomyces sp. NPDC053431]|uniref:hypothetical protein n=1 Tax=Streptomyces sp. NPDC053431 TaxID=3365703 RepID=UPI0037D4B993